MEPIVWSAETADDKNIIRIFQMNDLTLNEFNDFMALIDLLNEERRKKNNGKQY